MIVSFGTQIAEARRSPAAANSARKIAIRFDALDLLYVPGDVGGQEERPLLDIQRPERRVRDDVFVTSPGDVLEKRQRLVAACEEFPGAVGWQPSTRNVASRLRISTLIVDLCAL
jgi:hypothetical protein